MSRSRLCFLLFLQFIFTSVQIGRMRFERSIVFLSNVAVCIECIYLIESARRLPCECEFHTTESKIGQYNELLLRIASPANMNLFARLLLLLLFSRALLFCLEKRNDKKNTRSTQREENSLKSKELARYMNVHEQQKRRKRNDTEKRGEKKKLSHIDSCENKNSKMRGAREREKGRRKRRRRRRKKLIRK